MNFIVFFSGKKFRDYPFTMPRFYHAYKELFDYLKKQFPDIKLFIARNAKQFKNGSFRLVWEYKNGKFLKCKQPIKPDIVWNKNFIDRFSQTGDFLRINSPELEEICIDKWKTYQTFHKIIPGLPKNKLLSQIKNSGYLEREFIRKKIIIKPREGFLSRSVKIPQNLQDAKRALNQIKQQNIDNQYIVENFEPSYLLEKVLNLPFKKPTKISSKIQPELRVLITPFEHFFTIKRSIVNRYHIRGITRNVSLLDQIKPHMRKKITGIIKKIEQVFKSAHYRFYAVDLAANEQGEIFFYEINSMPGVPRNSNKNDKNFSPKYYQILANLIRKMIK